MPGPGHEPVDTIEWVPTETLHSNDFNPNHVFSVEMELLKTSILDTGWTMPIVALKDGTIIDGFHRWTLASRDPQMRARFNGLCPVMKLNLSPAEHRMATVRHNRARGYHGMMHMAEIVRELKADGMSNEAIEDKLGMEREEVIRLLDTRSTPEIQKGDTYGEGWAPAKKRRPKQRG